jgi:hypothetical protein
MQEAIRSTDPIAPSPPLPYSRILQKVQRDRRGATLPASSMRRDLGEGEKRSDSRPPRQGESFRPVLVQNPHGGFSTVRLAPSCAVGLRGRTRWRRVGDLPAGWARTPATNRGQERTMGPCCVVVDLRIRYWAITLLGRDGLLHRLARGKRKKEIK